MRNYRVMKVNKPVRSLVRSRSKSGFSLVEMLVTITIIAVIATIAVPNFHDLGAVAREKKNLRNAQNIASVYSAALACGADVTGEDKIEIIDKLRVGINGIGAFETHTFVIGGLSEQERDLAAPYLKLDGNPEMMTYTVDPR